MLECPVCENHGFKSLFALNNSDIVECTKCLVLYVPSPAPEVTAIYKASYFKGDQSVHGYGNYEGEYESHYQTFQARIRETEKLLGGRGRVLDVGCALGHFGKVAKDRGWDVFVTDVSDFAVQKSSLEYGLKGFVSSPDKLPVRAGHFDCVTLFDVIEHVSQPIELLKNLRAAIHKNGLLHLTTPNKNSLSGRLMGRHWFHFKPEEHLIYFDPKTISIALEKAGFEVLQIKPMMSYMKIKDILARLSKYSKPVTAVALKAVQWLGLDEKIIQLYVGEIEVWARPRGDKSSGLSSRNLKIPLKIPRPVDIEPMSLMEATCCPHCKSDLYKEKHSHEILCTKCNSSYEIVAGVIDFSRYGKRATKKIAG